MLGFDNRIIGQRAGATGIIWVLEIGLIDLANGGAIIFKRANFTIIARPTIMHFRRRQSILDAAVKLFHRVKTSYAHFAVIGHGEAIVVD